MSSPLDELAHNYEHIDTRRERVKLAQRAYRRRHASKVQKLQDENQRLKTILRDIHRLATNGDVSTESDLLDAIANVSSIETGSRDEKDTCTTQQIVRVGPIGEPDESTDLRQRLRIEPSVISSSRRLSPRLDHGLWLDTDRLVHIFDPPLDIVPYLGESLHTLPGYIFWACITHSVNRWQAVKYSGSSKESAKLTLSQIFNHSKHLGDHDFIISLALTRLDYIKRGSPVHPTSQRHDENETPNSHQLVEAEYNALGHTKDHWKNPEEVDAYIRRLVSGDKKIALDAITEGRASTQQQELFMPLITALASNFVCFGDGPRWSLVYISMTVGGWLKT